MNCAKKFIVSHIYDTVRLSLVPGLKGTPQWSQHLRIVGVIRVGNLIIGTDGEPLEDAEREAIVGWLPMPAPTGLLPDDMPGPATLSVLAARPS
jgi:hypothetical protein